MLQVNNNLHQPSLSLNLSWRKILLFGFIFDFFSGRDVRGVISKLTINLTFAYNLKYCFPTLALRTTKKN